MSKSLEDFPEAMPCNRASGSPAERAVTMFMPVTGKPSTAEVEKKLDSLARAGVDSFLFYPTSGMGFRYLGGEFFACAQQFAAGAEKRGMKMWLYDEYNWPSGTCRGRVPAENDRYRLAEISLHRNADGSFRWEQTLAPQGWVNLLEPMPEKFPLGSLASVGLGGYTGEATYSAAVDVPAGKGVRLVLHTGNAFTRVNLGGVDLGVRFYPPFEWPVPDSLAGRLAEMSATVYTSIMPMFGDPSAANWNVQFWVPPWGGNLLPGLLSQPIFSASPDFCNPPSS